MTGLPARYARPALALFGLLLVAAPLVTGRYGLAVLIQIFYLAYLGQAWNIMMGFAGLLSLGHALYIGLGAYIAGGLFVHYGIPAAIGLFPAMAAAAAAGVAIGWLGFRFRIGGVYFALLTIAFAELARIGFDHLDWVNASGGLFLPVDTSARFDLLHLRGGIALYYYVMLGLAGGALALSALLLRSRLGYYWLAIREDEEAARALGIPVFRCRLAAVALSAAMTAAGGVFNAFYYNDIFAETIFSVGSSIEILLAPIVGGLGTLMGPILGAFILTPLDEVIADLTAATGVTLPGIGLALNGLFLVIVIRALPGGVWPWIARHLFARRARPEPARDGEPAA
jgi:branched-chain amino acid transport system permease protein